MTAAGGSVVTYADGGRPTRYARRQLIEALNALHPDEMSPRDALEALYALKGRLAKK